MQSVFRRSASLPLYTFLLIHTSPLSRSFSLPLISTEGSIHSDIFLGRTYLQGRMHVLAGKVACISVEDAVHCKDGCSALQGRMQCTARTDAVHCEGGCSALRLRWAKRGIVIASPILDKRKGREEDSIGALHPPGYFCRTAENDFRHKRMISLTHSRKPTEQKGAVTQPSTIALQPPSAHG